MANGISGKKQLEQLNEVINDLKVKYGHWQVRWGSINRYQRLTGNFSEVYDDNKESLAVPLSSSRWGSLPAFESRSMYSSKGRYGFSGNSFIAAVEFGKKVKAKTIVTGGHSNNPLSTHFKDQAEGFVYGKFKDVFFYKEDVMNNKEKEYRPGE
jgi:acyl-homoserine lactone acylase PvdQ